jgi:hypothetical protein
MLVVGGSALAAVVEQLLGDASVSEAVRASCAVERPPSGPASARVGVAALRELTRLLHSQGRTLRQVLTEDGVPAVAFGDAGGAKAAAPSSRAAAREADEPKGDLTARRQFLQARDEERQYAQLVASVQKEETLERKRESFAMFYQQTSIGMNLIFSLLTAVACGYFMGVMFYGKNRQEVRKWDAWFVGWLECCFLASLLPCFLASLLPCFLASLLWL